MLEQIVIQQQQNQPQVSTTGTQESIVNTALLPSFENYENYGTVQELWERRTQF